MVQITISSAQIAKLTRALGHIKNGVPKALSPAINRALNTGRTVIKREIRKSYVIKAKDIPIKVVGATRSTLGGAIIIQQGMLDLNKFPVRPMFPVRGKGRKPVWAQVRKGGGGTMPGAFVSAVPSGYVGPFIRKGSSRLPIQKLVTIGAPIMASQPSVGPAANKAMGDTLDKRLDHEMKRVLASAGGSS
jgi:hypothetical protein